MQIVIGFFFVDNFGVNRIKLISGIQVHYNCFMWNGINSSRLEFHNFDILSYFHPFFFFTQHQLHKVLPHFKKKISEHYKYVM